MMKCLFLLLMTLYSVAIIAQQKETVRLIPPHRSEKIRIPFSEIEVIDARYDRSYCGQMYFETDSKKEIVSLLEVDFPDSLNGYLPRVLKSLVEFNNETEERLVILVKRFRLTDHIDQTRPVHFLVLNSSLSFYAAKGDRYFRINSFEKQLAEELPLGVKRKDVEKIKAEAFGNILEEIFRNRSWEKTKNAFTLADIEKGIYKRYDLPVLREDLKTGGYASFKEFINNKPSILNISAVVEKNTLVGFRTSDGKLLDPSSCWGASDGNNAYIVHINTFYQLIRKDHGFRYYYKTPLSEITGLYKKKIFEDEKPILFHLNMEDGTPEHTDLIRRDNVNIKGSK